MLTALICCRTLSFHAPARTCDIGLRIVDVEALRAPQRAQSTLPVSCERLPATRFDHLATVEYVDEVGVADGAQTVRDHQDRGAAMQLLNGALDASLALAVQVTGRLVEH